LLRGHDAAVTDAAFDTRGRWIVTGSADHSVRLWNLSSGEPWSATDVVRLPKERFHPARIAIDCKGHWLVAGAGDGTIRVWDLDAGQLADPAIVLQGRAEDCVAIDPYGRWLTSGEWLWDLRAKPSPLRYLLRGHKGPITSSAIDGKGRRLVTGSEDATAKI